MGYGFSVTLVGTSTFWKLHLGMDYAHGSEIFVIIVADSGLMGCVSPCRRERAWKTKKVLGDVFKRNS